MKRSFKLPAGTVSAAALMLGASPAFMVGLGAALGLVGPGLHANGQWAEQRLKSFGFAGQAARNPISLAQGRDGALYGTTIGRSYNYGDTFGPAVVFTLSTNGSGFTVLHRFEDWVNLNAVAQGRDGAWYGTTQNGGPKVEKFGGFGSVFKLNADGTGYAVLHSFTGSGGDGAYPYAGVAQGSDGALYGTTSRGGTDDNGTVFKLNADGTGYAVLHRFDFSIGDGGFPSGLVQGSDSALYGTTGEGGTNGIGAVFRLNTDGTGYTVLHNFTGIGGDGATPSAGLLLGRDGALYGTTFEGGPNGSGTVFRLNTDGTGYRVLHTFTGSVGDGVYPNEALVQGSDGALYGTTSYGGTNGSGTIFKLRTDGTGYAVVHNFTGSAGDGAIPLGGLVQGSDGAMYGASEFGGWSRDGTLFKLNGDGTTYSVLYGFSSSGGDGASPSGALVQGSDGALYGTASAGGTNDSGSVFKLNTDGTGYAVLYRFGSNTGDGRGPSGVVQGSDGAFYGTTSGGGTNGNGTVFRLNADGTGYKVLHVFTGSGGDGASPYGGLTRGGDRAMYGTTESGGGYTNGTVFKLNTDGTGYTVLHSFTGIGGDGANPFAGLVLGSDGALYGTTGQGGTNGLGTVFKLNTDGTGYTGLYRFTDNGGDGAYPGGRLVQGNDGSLYGTTSGGGDLGLGTVFRFGPVLPPRLTQLGRSEGGDIQLTVSGAPYVAWRVEVATNLTAPVTWAPLATVPFTNGPVQLSDPGATNSLSRFYRAVWP